MCSQGQFAKLFRTSKFVSLYKPDVKVTKPSKFGLPTRQVIYTTPQSKGRNDFGLKRPVPAKNTSSYITVDEYDTVDHMTMFNSGSSYHRRLQRFQELEVAVSSKGMESSDFERDSFKKWLLEKHNISFNSFLGDSFLFKSNKAREYLLEVNPSRQDISGAKKVIGTAGLSYNLKGALHNTRDGVSLHKTFKGRILEQASDSTVAGIGGFVAHSKISSSVKARNRAQNSVGVAQPEDFVVSSATLSNYGKVNLEIASPDLEDDINRTREATSKMFNANRSGNRNIGNSFMNRSAGGYSRRKFNFKNQ
ncbi:hypothetical protein NADFUDRAFT_84548 [Nadsonia fulvescens var. elongata DSM 6958]|uniref:Uncharacterized protein n=1 Tax=Nadsonia fulvescens var. elongata DSM 6958 TaxID=857566 RepID=A0A1E3PCC0_9ASCO|nr:hypothetical protein NADFUDRAFT_84548 [Nadsonia fulvescens var. elongata DSM 6958]